MSHEPLDPAEDGAKMTFSDAMSYGDYLRIEDLLALQTPLSDAPDELLFIIQHQTSELWMKLAIHELNAARIALRTGATARMFKQMARVSRIFEQLNAAWDVLRTMTPADYTTFREALGPSSGFQSHQYRMIEFILGNRNPHMLHPHAHRPELHRALAEEMRTPSLYHEVINVLFKELGGALPEFELSEPHSAHKLVTDKWQQVYENTDRHWTLYELAEKLIDLEDYFRRWRFNHVTTVERVIGFKRGTGGTSGVSYLRRMLDTELFPELWQVRGRL